jgi:trans-aconitate methyltransferase
MIQDKYDAAAAWYEYKYVMGGWENNPYMKDEHDAYKFWQEHGEVGNIISIGVGSGQDIEILGNPDPKTFKGYDISSGMLENARKKFPTHEFIQADCEERLTGDCDILVSMFGAPNYIGISKLLQHYMDFNAKHAFFIIYNEHYDDGFDEYTHKYTQDQLKHYLAWFNPIVQKLNDDYYIVKW